MPLTPDELLTYLSDLGIAVSTVRHPPLRTVEESRELRGAIPGGHTKNLFLKDRKDNYFLLTVGEDAVVNLKTVHTVIGAASRLSFGNAEKLMDYLGVVPGAVTVFGAVNDRAGKVKIVLDADLMANETINGHPLTNEATTTIARGDLIRFRETTGHGATVLKVTEGIPT
jgi:Ala-tRNA(Pro) deacylase